MESVRAELSKKIEETNKRIDSVHAELSAKIDSLNRRIDETTIETNKRIDQLTFQVGKIAQEMERIRTEETIARDLLTRVARLEKRVIGE